MGKAYHLKCSGCGWNEIFCLGIGICDGEAQAHAAVEHLLAEPDGDDYAAFIFAQESIVVNMERNLYRCRSCGKLQVRFQVQVCGEGRTLSPAYYCESCGKLLVKIRPHMIRKLPCPDCGAMVEIESITNWDIAPKAETAMRV